MNKKLFIFILFLGFNYISQSRNLSYRRIDGEVLYKQQIENSTREADILKSLSAYDFLQAWENAGRLFIRDKIIYP